MSLTHFLFCNYLFCIYVKDHGNGTYDISYEDGDFESKISLDLISKVDDKVEDSNQVANQDMVKSNMSSICDVDAGDAKKCSVWRELLAKINKNKAERESWQYHFCTICGISIACKRDVTRHAKLAEFQHSHRFMNDSHVMLLDNAKSYFNHIKSIDPNVLHSKVVKFLKTIKLETKNRIEKEQEENIPAVIASSKAWADMQAIVDETNNTPAYRKWCYCPICGAYIRKSTSVTAHVHKYHDDSHSNFHLSDVPFLNDVSDYYRHLKKIDNSILHQRAKKFLADVNAEVHRHEAEKSILHTSSTLR